MQQKRKTEIAGCLGEIFMLTSSHIYSLSFHTGHLIITSNFFPVCGWFPGPLFSCFCHSVQFSSPAMSNSLRPHGLQHTSLPCPLLTPRACSNSCHWVDGAIQPSHPLLSPSPPPLNLSQHQGLFQWAGSSHQVAKVLEFQLQHQSFQLIFRIDFLQDWLVGSPCSPRDSQESSPTPQLKSINSSVLSFLYSPTLTSIHDYWKNHSFD